MAPTVINVTAQILLRQKQRRPILNAAVLQRHVADGLASAIVERLGKVTRTAIDGKVLEIRI